MKILGGLVILAVSMYIGVYMAIVAVFAMTEPFYAKSPEMRLLEASKQPTTPQLGNNFNPQAEQERLKQAVRGFIAEDYLTAPFDNSGQFKHGWQGEENPVQLQEARGL